MDLPQFLARQNITLEAIASRAREELRLTDGDVLFVCGSLVEGLGNESSDVDLFLITPRRDIRFTSLNDVALVVGSCVCDVRVIDRAVFEQLLESFAQWAARPRMPRSAEELNEDDRRLLHRLWNGTVLHGAGELERFRERVPHSGIARHKLDLARHHVTTLQIDLAGMRASGDWTTLLFVAQDLLGHVVDALLAGHGFTNPTRKWRARLLERLPASWEQALPGRPTGLSAVERYLSLHHSPREMTPGALYDFALRIVAFSRVVLPWAEQRLLASELPLLPAVESVEAGGDPLPALDLDVTLRYREGSFELVRVNAQSKPYRLSPEACSLLSLFDGQTSQQHAARHAARLWGEAAGAEHLDSLLALVRYAGLAGRPPVDIQAIRELLRDRQ